MDARVFHPVPNTHGLVLHYKLFAGLSGNAKVVDYSPRGNDGVILGALPAYPGFSFAGATDSITKALPSELPTGVLPRTTAMWLKTSISASDQITLDYGVAGAGARWTEFVNFVTGVYSVTVHGGNVRGNAVIADDTWHHVAIVNAGEKVEDSLIYTDGENTGYASTITEPLQTVGAPLSIGVDTDGSTSPFDGTLDEVRVYNRVLSAAEVKDLYGLTRWRYAV